jgi:hypothetical protein
VDFGFWGNTLSNDLPVALYSVEENKYFQIPNSIADSNLDGEYVPVDNSSEYAFLMILVVPEKIGLSNMPPGIIESLIQSAPSVSDNTLSIALRKATS